MLVVSEQADQQYELIRRQVCKRRSAACTSGILFTIVEAVEEGAAGG